MVLPYCAIGNVTLTLGSLAWTLVGAQGRYNVATFHGCIGRYVYVYVICNTTLVIVLIVAPASAAHTHSLSWSLSLSLYLSLFLCTKSYSLFVTIPCACVSIFYFQWGLPSLAASVVIGYMVSGAFNSVTLLLSDWEYISYRVMIRNGATEPVEDDDEDSDEYSPDDDGNDDGNDAVVHRRWNLLQYMRGGNNKSNNNEKGTSFISVINNQKEYAGADAGAGADADDDDMSAGTNNTEFTSGVIKKSSSWWTTFGTDHKENELRRVVLGPGKLGFIIQSTKVNYSIYVAHIMTWIVSLAATLASRLLYLSDITYNFYFYSCSFFFILILQRMDRWSWAHRPVAVTLQII
jgi:hypothetical protein